MMTDEIRRLGLYPGRELEQEILDHFEQFIFYEPQGKRERIWKCTACGTTQAGWITGQHGDKVVCPECRAQAKLIAAGRIKSGNSLRKYEKVLYFRAVDGDLFAMAADVELVPERESFDGPDFDTFLNIWIRQIYHWSGPGTGKPEMWTRGWDNGWTWSESIREPFQGGFNYYYRDDTYAVFGYDEIKKSNMKYCCLGEYLKDKYGMFDIEADEGSKITGAVKYLSRYQMQPKLELAVKWGFSDVVQEYVEGRKENRRVCDWTAGTPWGFLRMTKQQFKAYRECGGCLEMLKDNRQTWKLPVDALFATSKNMPKRYSAWAGSAEEIHRKYGLQLQDIARYHSKGNDLRHWRDYLDMAEKCGRDLTDHNTLYPKNLKQAHDDAVELYRVRKAELDAAALKEQELKFRERYEKLVKKYEYTTGDLTFIVPETAGQLISEGNTLHICVGGYATRYLEGKTDIIFLRHTRRPERSYICIEVREDRIIQVHGYKNEGYKSASGKDPVPPSKKYQDILSEWMEVVRNRKVKTA